MMRFALLGFGFLRRSNTYILVGVTTSYGLWVDLKFRVHGMHRLQLGKPTA
jgi:hypothetical protein